MQNKINKTTERVNYIIEKLGFKQSYLAKMTKMSQSLLSLYRGGKRLSPKENSTSIYETAIKNAHEKLISRRDFEERVINNYVQDCSTEQLEKYLELFSPPQDGCIFHKTLSIIIRDRKA